MRSLERTHPLCCFAFLLAVFGITIFTRSPILLAESLAGASLLLILSGRARFAVLAALAIPISAAVNPVFSHRGETVLFFAGDLAVTLESVLYGAVFGVMLAAVVCWSAAAAKYMTGDKYIWLFGRIAPLCGLVLSCSFRLVPLFARRSKDFTAAQSEGFRSSVSAFSAAVGYSAEQAMMSADSMRARGYGTARRTSYLRYRFNRVAAIQLAVIVLTGAVAVGFMAMGGGAFAFYPAVSGISAETADVLLYCAFGVLCALPSVQIVVESIKRCRIPAAVKEH